MPTAERIIAAQEYFALTEGQRWTELIGGRIVVNIPRIPHQTLVGRLHHALGKRSGASAAVFDVEAELVRAETLGSAQLPGFGIVLDALFAEP